MKRWLALGILPLLLGCSSPPRDHPLEVVPHPVHAEPVQLSYRWEATFEAPDARASEPLELWLPLPTTIGDQLIHSVLWEVGPPGTYQVEETASGDRVLHVSSSGESLPQVRLRARVDRTLNPKQAQVPKGLSALKANDPRNWVVAAKKSGTQARLVHGVVKKGPQTQAMAWPEIQSPNTDRWVAVDLATKRLGLPRGRVRLSVVAPRAVQNGRDITLTPRYTLEER